MAFIADFAELLGAILSLFKQPQCVAVTTPSAKSFQEPTSSTPPSTSECPGYATSVAPPLSAQAILPRQITVDEGSTTTTLLCNPAHSYPGCQSCISGTAFGTTPGCTVSSETSSTTTSTTTPTTSTTTTSTPSTTTTPSQTPTLYITTSEPTTRTSSTPSTSSGSNTPSQVFTTTTQSRTYGFTSVIVPSVPTPSTTANPIGSESSLTPSTTHITFPTTPYTGQSLLVGTCTIPMYTALIMSDGGILEVPIIGCADDRPDCCPSLSTTSNPTTSTSTVVVPVYESTVVVSALSANPITVCPSDYADLGSVCCPAGFSLYSQAVIGQTPCYTVLPTDLNPNAASAAISSISAQIAATASPSSTPTISVQVVTNEVFALSLPHTSHKSLSLSTQIGVGVGAGVGGLLLLLLLGWAFSLWRKLRGERDQNRLSAGPGSGLTPIASVSLNSGSMSQQPSLPSTGPSPPIPSPPEMQHRSYPPWVPYGSSGAQQPYQQTYPQPQPGQLWQQTPGSAPYLAQGQPGPQHMTAIPETYPEGFHDGYREVSGVQTETYETSANLPRPGVSRMPDGTIYTAPVEMGRSNTPRVVQNLQSLQRGGGVSVNF